jgi:outer membrane immunogenic protein
MKRLAIALSAVIGLSVGAVQSASAADLPMKAPPMVSAPPPSWTGFYAGGSLGGRWSDTTWTTSLTGGPPSTFDSADPTTSPTNLDSATFRVGGYLGYNWQVAPLWVVGLEGDLAWGDSKKTIAGIPGTYTVGGPETAHDSVFAREQWDASIRARIGFLITPTWLLYATGGVAFQDFEFGASCDGASRQTLALTSWCAPGFARNESVSSIRTGWTVGGGIEAMLSKNWLVRGEYRYSDFGSVNHTFFPAPATNDAFIMGISLKTQMALFGIAYKFN